MTKEAATKLAGSLAIGLGSHGVCPACLSFVAFALAGDDERRVAGQVTSIAPVLWGEGLDVSALHSSAPLVRATIGRRRDSENSASGARSSGRSFGG